MRHVIAVSGGKDSTALALRLMEAEPRDYEFLITPTGNELPEMVEHWARLETLLGKPLTRLKPFSDGDGLLHLIDHFRALPNDRMRWCTRMLKIQPTVAWLSAHAPCVQNVGLRADEPAGERGGIYGDIPGVEQRYPLREWGWGVEDVWGYLAERGVKIPKRTDCAWCYGQRLIEWKRLLESHPELYAAGEAVEARIGHTFRSPSRDTWPAGLAGLRAEFESGRKVRGEKSGSAAALEMYQEPEGGKCRVCSL